MSTVVSSPKDLWSLLTKATTPSQWYTENLRTINEIMLLGVWDLDWIETKLVVGKKEIEKVQIISSEARDMRTVILGEKLKVKGGTLGQVDIRDIRNYLEDGLPDAPKMFGISEEDKTYAAIRVMFEIHSFFMNNFKVPLQITLGSTILRILQTNYIDRKIPRLQENVDKFIESSFVGGRGEVHKIYCPHTWGYDKNGLFAEAYTNSLPVKSPYFIKNPSIESVLSSKRLGWAEVDVYVPENLSRSPLYCKHPSRTTTFPVGLLKNRVYFIDQLKDAVKEDHCNILKVHRVCYFANSADFLKKWAEDTGKLKENATTKGERYLARMCQNIGWGKFAQKETRKITHLGIIPESRRQDKSISIISDDIPIWFEEVTSKSPNHLIQIAAAVTSWAMIIMNREARKHLAEGLHLAYEDVDSQFLDGPLSPEYIGKKLGQYKEEFVDKELLAPAVKTYIIRGAKIEDAKIKGLPNYIPSERDWDKIKDGNGSIITKFVLPATIPEILVKRYLYGKEPTKFVHALQSSSHEETRQFPGRERQGVGLLELDNKRCHTSLTESRPWRVEELCPKS